MCNAGLESKLFFGGFSSPVSLVCVWGRGGGDGEVGVESWKCPVSQCQANQNTSEHCDWFRDGNGTPDFGAAPGEGGWVFLWGVRLLVAWRKLTAGENVDGEGSDEI